MTNKDTQQYQTDDLRIRDMHELIPPANLIGELPITVEASQTVHFARQTIRDILNGDDGRLLVVVGPCSIHSVDVAMEYAQGLKALRDELSDDLFIVMRVYFEKPRTTVGWKGLINDPNLDGSFEINKGLRMARNLLLDLNGRGIPAGTEYLDLISPQYISDLVSWGAIGARTTESQAHRELASGLSCPVGFKNGTDGNLQIAIDALGSSSRPHHFLSVTKAGHSAIFATAGNTDCHVIMRGGKGITNYDAGSVNDACAKLEQAEQPVRLMVDLSHANSLKRHKNQLVVGKALCDQLHAGEQRIIGVMIESNLVEGRQDIEEGKELTYGQSVTDACLGWDDSVGLLRDFATAAKKRRGAGQ